MNEYVVYYHTEYDVFTNHIYTYEGKYYMNMLFFEYEHLPEYLQKVSKPFHDLAHELNDNLPECAEKAVGLRKLLEAKDCIVRVEVEVTDYMHKTKKKHLSMTDDIEKE